VWRQASCSFFRYFLYIIWREIVYSVDRCVALLVLLPARQLCFEGIVFGGVSLSVCPHKISKTTDVTVRICPMVNARSAWKLVTFWLWPLTLRAVFVFFIIRAIPVEWLYLATSFSVWRYIFRISRPRFSFKVKNYWSKNCWSVIGISVTITFWHFDFDLWSWDSFVFSNSSSKLWMS